jgi:hypothetical protein
MALTRSQKIVSRIRALLGEHSNQNITDDQIYYFLNDLQRRVAMDTMCLDKKVSLSVISGTATYDLATGNVVTSSASPTGLIGGKAEILVNSTNTTHTWDVPFTKEITDYAGSSEPAYRFIVMSAYVTNTAIQEEIQIVARTLTTITLKSTADTTRVSFAVYEVGGTTSATSGTATGLYRLNLIELPSGNTYQCEEITFKTIDDYKRRAIGTAQTPYYYALEDNVLELYPTPDTTETFILHMTKLPSTDMTSAVAPETPQEYDSLLVYGSVVDLAPSVGKFDLGRYYQNLYAIELAKATQRSVHKSTVSNQIPYRDFV